jgi:uncharacterized membrane protein YdjX (TVP38/TMEM64 family)
MLRYWVLVVLLLLFFLGAFLLVETLQPTFLSDPRVWMEARSVGAALAGVGMLVVDVVLPIPSSLVMILNGALFGILVGTLLSLLGALGAAIVGFLMGRRGGPLLVRFVPPADRERADRLLQDWGMLAIIATRSIPLLAETVIIMAGASSIPWRTMLLATLVGSLPMSLLYAITGATAATFANGLLSFSMVLLIAGLFWVIGRRAHSKATQDYPLSF